MDIPIRALREDGLERVRACTADDVDECAWVEDDLGECDER